MSSIIFTTGDVDEAISIMQEAAKWLIDTGKPMWRLEDICRGRINNPAEEFIVLWGNGIGVAAMMLSFFDPFFWPNVEKSSSGFIHKLSIRREFAGKGYAEKLIEYAKVVCRDKGIKALRLDCDSHRDGLCKFYEKAGFKLVEIKRIGTFDCAMYEMEIE